MQYQEDSVTEFALNVHCDRTRRVPSAAKSFFTILRDDSLL